MTDLIRHEDFIADEETGEVLQWPEGIGPDRMEYLMAQHRESAVQESLWATRKSTMSRVMEAQLGELGARNYTGNDYKAVHYAGGTDRRARAMRLREALQWGIVNLETYDAILGRCARDLDPDEIEAMLAERLITVEQADYLIDKTPRAGHVRTQALPRPAPVRRD